MFKIDAITRDWHGCGGMLTVNFMMTTPLRDGAVSGNVLMAKVEPNSGTVQYLFGPIYVLLGIDPEAVGFCAGKLLPVHGKQRTISLDMERVRTEACISTAGTQVTVLWLIEHTGGGWTYVQQPVGWAESGLARSGSTYEGGNDGLA